MDAAMKDVAEALDRRALAAAVDLLGSVPGSPGACKCEARRDAYRAAAQLVRDHLPTDPNCMAAEPGGGKRNSQRTSDSEDKAVSDAAPATEGDE